jgi:hypothetical protein
MDAWQPPQNEVRMTGFMICSNCQTTNADDANFCLNCGHRISLLCPRCSRRVLSLAKFCDGCGYSLQTQGLVQQEAISPEGRPVTGEPPPAAPPTTKVVAPTEEEILAPSVPEEMPQPETAVPQPAAVEPAAPTPSVDSPLAQYIPRELMQKLEAARSSGDMVG